MPWNSVFSWGKERAVDPSARCSTVSPIDWTYIPAGIGHGQEQQPQVLGLSQEQSPSCCQHGSYSGTAQTWVNSHLV